MRSPWSRTRPATGMSSSRDSRSPVTRAQHRAATGSRTATRCTSDPQSLCARGGVDQGPDRGHLGVAFEEIKPRRLLRQLHAAPVLSGPLTGRQSAVHVWSSSSRGAHDPAGGAERYARLATIVSIRCRDSAEAERFSPGRSAGMEDGCGLKGSRSRPAMSPASRPSGGDARAAGAQVRRRCDRDFVAGIDDPLRAGVTRIRSAVPLRDQRPTRVDPRGCGLD